ncbi:hypothetical protein Vadar_033098 [Vaccinium darrowii]|uniref:Uncharacterized protein n=1 Tax=Vaccinium darrowii TaxID=229202 RepID=A0ACB7Z0I0_9ERIC|nr:hypothetical protein Vadar_033098 [Vaccinium darrowii]
MEVTMETIEDDDLFFADLNKQISLLIMDDDDDPVAHCPSTSLQTLSRAIHPAAAESPFGYNHPLNWRGESKGTGVFIPQSLNPRRKNNRQGRSFISSSNTKVRSRRHSHNSRDHLLPPASSHFLKNSVSGSMDRLIRETNPTFL